MRDLRLSAHGEVVLPDAGAYDAARRVFNAMIDHRPALIARCAGAADVQASIAFAREHGLPVSVKGGGHNVSGKAVADGGLMVGLALVLFIGSAQAGGAAAQWLVRPGTTVVVGLVPFAVALAWLPYAPALPCLLVIGVPAGLPAAALVSAPTLVLGPASRAPGMGLFYTWYYAGMAVLPGIAGWLEDVLGRAAAIEFAAGAIVAALASDVAFRRLIVGQPV